MTPRVMVITPWDRMWSLEGGGAPSWAYLVEGLMDAGFALEIVAPRGDSRDYPINPRLTIIPAEPPRERTGLMSPQRYWLARSRTLGATATAFVREHGPPDVVYGFSAMAIPVAAYCAKRWRRPAVGKLFGTFLRPVVGHPLAAMARWDETLGFLAPVDRLVIHDDGTGGDEVARWLRVPSRRLRFWRNGVDREVCAAARRDANGTQLRLDLGLAADTPLIYTASRLVSWKRVDRIVRAMPSLLERKPNARLVIAGEGESREGLSRLAARLGVGDAVMPVGAVPRAQNLQLMAAADAFCATYDYSNLGNALFEAMSCGAAVVVTDTGRTRELVRHGQSGLVVPPDDEAALAAALTDVLSDPALRASLRDGALADSLAMLPTKDERIGWEIEMVRDLIGRS